MKRINLSPVRKIGKSASSLTGIVQSFKNEKGADFESSLERDYLTLVEADLNVDEFVIQPIEIAYEFEGKTRYYTPDVLIRYRDDIEDYVYVKPLLVEVKYRSTLWRDWKVLRPKLFAANKYAHSRGWNFKIITEKEIRTPKLENVKFLNEYRNNSQNIDSNGIEILLDLLMNFVVSTPEELVASAVRDKYKKAELIYTLWYMISQEMICCDLNKPLSMKTEIWQKK
jgi:hypothetical protein